MISKNLDIKQPSDIVAARQAGREIARELGFGSADQTRLATAISELTRNVIQHGGADGRCLITGVKVDQTTIRVKVEDHGPGISDMEAAMKWGYSTRKGLGAGLPGTKRLVHEFRIESKPGHTVVSIAMIRKNE